MLSDELLDDELGRELERVFGDGSGLPGNFMLLPLVSSADALAFFRTVPAGTPFDQLPGLASAYRAAHPVRPSNAEDSGGDAAI